ncbi:MAG TPA: LpqB family beta-propeller domain-containing protein [Terriglobales bacterium]|jgi:Tol biopolymer transport system component|nr:LpqB family beta-propeller domain-containing protein [Terriglobales bacterium]
MGISSGTRVGPYEIVSPLGAGGMGEVYRARDSRLGREVAIKLLPSSFSQDADRLRRFEQEAQAASALNHPNILAVYDVGTHDGAPYLVMELLEGATLRDRLSSGALPPRKAVEFAVQIAQGLAAAHDKGIVHRDLKPENIYACRDGRIKILDFGLAKLIAPEPGDATVTGLDNQTEAGVVMGTAGYMSPEQVRGEKADQRSDIFSFGAVLYEMLSGERAFGGRSLADRASAILKEDPPDLLASGRNVPAALERIVHHCLEKDAERRFQSARDLAFHLESSSSISESGAAAALASSRTGTAGTLRWLIVFLVLVGAAAGAWWFRGRAQSGPGAVKFLRLTDYVGMEESPAFSPDGKAVAFVCDSTETRQIWIRLLAGGPPLQVTNSPGAHLEPRWSQDSAAIIYFTPPTGGSTQGALWEVSALGGAPRQLVSSMSGGDVSHDGKRLTFFRLNGRQIELVVADRDGSNPRVLTQAAPTFSYRQPRWSPDDNSIAYLHSQENWSDDVYVVSSTGGAPRRLTSEVTLMSGLAWSPDGSHLIYSTSRGSTLLYLPTLHLWQISKSGGKPQQLTFGEAGDESPDVDRDGRVVVSRKRMQFDIWKFPVSGEPAENVRGAVRITHQTGQVHTPSLDPSDHELVYLSDSGGHANLWVLPLGGGEPRQITFEKDPNVVVGVPIWSPDGSLITFASARLSAEVRGVSYWVVHPDGSGLRFLVDLGTWATWSGDSKWLYYSESSPVQPTGSFRLMKMPVGGGTPVVVRTDNARGPAVAPDGSALYYVVPLQNLNGSMDYELRVARPENGPSTLLARISGERAPLWQGLHPVISKDGKWLVMPLDDNMGSNIWVASTADGKLRRITDFGQRRTFIARRISWSSDGKWVFAAVGEGDADIVQMDGLLN